MFFMQVKYGDLRRGGFYSDNLDFMVKTKLRILTGEFHPLSIKEIYAGSKNGELLGLPFFSFDLCFCVLFI
jgi:hypothetical protein